MTAEKDQDIPTDEDINNLENTGKTENKNKKYNIYCKLCGSEHISILCRSCGYNEPKT